PGRLPQTPDKAIAITTYPVREAATHGHADSIGMQVRVRGTTDPRVALDLDDEIFNLTQGFTGHLSNGIGVTLIDRNSQIPLGQDGNNRWEITSNYYLTLTRDTDRRNP